MDENTSGADLEEAHLYHTIREFEEVWCKYGADVVLKMYPRLLITVVPDILCYED